MLNLVDSCGWLEYFTDGANAEAFSVAIEDSAQLVVPSICIHEVFKKILRERDEHTALVCVSAMMQGSVVDLDARLGVDAARLGILHSLPMADSIILATARLTSALVWTQDAHFRGLQGVRFFDIPQRR